MKKQALAVAAALIIGSVVMAQAAPANPPPQGPGQGQVQDQQQIVKISGKLELIKGHIALKSGNVTYYIARLGQYAGFIKDLQEGAQVSLEGYIRTFPNTLDQVIYMPTKLSINGRDYDLGQPLMGPGLGGKGQKGTKGMRGMERDGFGPMGDGEGCW